MPLPNVINIVLWSGYLDMTDRSNYSMVCVKAAQKLLSTESILEGISHSPVRECCRFEFWRWAIGRELDYSIFEPLHGGDTLGYYMHHRALLTSTINKKTSGQLGEIMRDVGRTYPEHPFFDAKNNQPGEILLARVLCATLSSTPNIGYCQGMNFVVATLLLARIPKHMIEESYQNVQEGSKNESTGDNECEEEGGGENSTIVTRTSSVEDSKICQYDEIEAEVFWMFQSILIKNDRGLEMEFIWKPSFPKMKLRVFQFDRLLELYLPAIHTHFEDMSLSPEVVVSQWFMTLFSNTLPLPFTFQMWDYMFIANWPGIFRATLAILYVLQEKLLDMDLEEVGLLIRDWKRGKFDIPVKFSELLGSAETFDIDLNSLIMLQENYAVEMIAASIGDQLDASSSVGKSYHGGCMGLPRPGGDSWLRRYGEFPEEMRADMLLIHNEINELSVQVDRDKAVLQNKILKACELCEHAYDDLDKALRAEMQWLQYTSNLKHELSCWEKKANTALAELKWANENEKQSAAAKLAYGHEDEDEDESDDDSEEEDSDDDDYSGSSESTSSGEYIDEEGTNSSGDDDDEEYTSCSDSEETSDSSTPRGNGNGNVGAGGGGGGSFFFDAVSNMTNMLIPVTASATPSPPVSSNAQQVAAAINHDKPILNSHQNGMIVESTMPQQTEYDDNKIKILLPEDSPHRHSSIDSQVSSPSSSPEIIQDPSSGEMTSLAQKIRAHPQRRRTTSNPGLKQQSQLTPTTSPVTIPSLPPVITTSVVEALNLNEEVEGEAARSVSTGSIPTTGPDVLSVANINTANNDIVSGSPKQVQELTTTATAIATVTVNIDETQAATVNGAAPKSPTRFQHFKSNVLGKSKSTDSSEGSGGAGGGTGAGGGGGGRIGFSRRYITSKLERRKAKIMKAKECHFLHKQIIKSSKQVEIAKKRLFQAKESKQIAQVADEEAKQWKESLCGQFSTLVKDADSRRSQKLIYIVDTYGM